MWGGAETARCVPGRPVSCIALLAGSFALGCIMQHLLPRWRKRVMWTSLRSRIGSYTEYRVWRRKVGGFWCESTAAAMAVEAGVPAPELGDDGVWADVQEAGWRERGKNEARGKMV